MGGKKKETQQVDSKTDPWAPAQPLLKDILGRLQPMVGSSGINPNESAAISGLRTNAQQPNEYAPRIGMLADDLLTGGTDRTGMVQGGYDDYRAALTPFARGDYLDPTTDPQLQKMVGTVSDDITGRIRSQFAAAGRDFSGAETGAIARGVSSGTAPIMYDAVNRARGEQLGAIDKIFGGSGATAGMLSGLDQTAFGNRAMGVDVSGAARNAIDDPFNRQLGIEGMERGIPQQNLGWLASLGLPMAGLGGAQSGTTTSTTDDPNEMWKNIIGGAVGGLGLLAGNPMGMMGTASILGGAGVGARSLAGMGLGGAGMMSPGYSGRIYGPGY